ncbi:MAG TPA: aldehyde dehydrogenase family protein [Acidimicrobiales bacterium]
MIVRDTIYIDGAWVPSSGKGTIDVINSTTEEVMGTIPDGSADDVNRAVAAAKKAFPAWAATSVEERAKYCSRIAEGIAPRMDEIATLVSQEVGMVKPLSLLVQAGLPFNSFNVIQSIVDEFPWEERIGNSLVVREPIGVVGCITPWNYPLHQIAAKVAFALAAGCTVVLKPSEVAPLNAFVLAEIINDTGLPAGVFNMVSGVGPVVGEAIASHPDVDMVSFTGSTRAGRRVAELASARVAKVALELGGKSANVILSDADLKKAVSDGVGKAFLNSGQTCSALTRMLVPREKLAEAEQIAASAAEAMTVGDPFAESSKLGPLVSQAQWDRVEGYIQKGIDEGAKVVAGGPGKPEGLEQGFFVKPTVFSNVKPDMTIAQEEIFGPVLSILPYDSEDEAVEIANGTPYGLAGGVWAGSQERAEAIARRLRTGQVEVNGGAFNPNAPFGGYKQSGVGREYGRYGLEEFLQVKSLQL